MSGWSPIDLAYLAGFIDGEGSICVFPYRNRRASALRLCAYNTNVHVLQWIAVRFGGKVRAVKRRRQTWRQSYVWEISAQAAAQIITACLPYLKIKQQQGALFVAVAETLDTKKGRHRKTSATVLEFRLDAARRISALNKGATDAS